MLRHAFAQPLLLWSLAVLPALALLAAWSAHRRRRALARLASPAAVAALRTGKPRLGRLRGLCVLLGLAGVGVAAAGPQWGRDWQQPAPGRDLVVVLDCSRSMLAETPSRLELAREALDDLARALQRSGGHRVALIGFAGKPRILCPLTPDYDHFRAALKRAESLPDEADVRPGPGIPSGTRIGAALSEAVSVHDPRFPGARDILLLSDGDDPARDGEWAVGAAAAREEGIPVYVIGIGNPEKASPVPGPNGPIVQDDEPVRSSLQEGPLQEIARLTQGKYYPAHTRALALGRLYLDRIAKEPRREVADDALPAYRPRYVWFLLPALGLLAAALTLPESGRRRPGPSSEDRT
jgi:Ca-activated chloride channel family protein